jgi:hypothetical protein
MGAAVRRIFLGLALMLWTIPAAADQTQGAPELDIYETLSPVTRLFFTGIGYPDRTAVFEFGPSVDFLLRPIVRDAILGPNEARRRELTFRMGYHYLLVPGEADENRGVLELTPRQTFPGGLTLSDRNRSDLRWIAGDFSWRYRNRIGLERSFKHGAFIATPYARFEWYYDGKSASWSRTAWSVGSIFPIADRYEVEPYFERDRDERASPLYLNLIGLIASLYY